MHHYILVSCLMYSQYVIMVTTDLIFSISLVVWLFFILLLYLFLFYFNSIVFVFLIISSMYVWLFVLFYCYIFFKFFCVIEDDSNDNLCWSDLYILVCYHYQTHPPGVCCGPSQAWRLPLLWLRHLCRLRDSCGSLPTCLRAAAQCTGHVQLRLHAWTRAGTQTGEEQIFFIFIYLLFFLITNLGHW